MEEKNKNKKMVFIIITIIVLTFVIIGFIVYDNLFKIDNTVNNITTTNNITTQEYKENFKLIKFNHNDETVESIVLNYLEKCNNASNCFKIDDYENYQDEKISDNIKLTCNNYDYETEEDGNKFCYSATLNIDNKVKFIYDNNWNLGLANIDILKSNQFYIVQEQSLNYGRGRIVIYDNDGNKLKEINNTTTYLTVLDENGNIIETNIEKDEYKIKLINNKLYYAYTEDDYDNFCINSRNSYVHIGYIDLNNNFEIVELQKVRGFASQEC